MSISLVSSCHPNIKGWGKKWTKPPTNWSQNHWNIYFLASQKNSGNWSATTPLVVPPHPGAATRVHPSRRPGPPSRLGASPEASAGRARTNTPRETKRTADIRSFNIYSMHIYCMLFFDLPTLFRYIWKTEIWSWCCFCVYWYFICLRVIAFEHDCCCYSCLLLRAFYI